MFAIELVGEATASLHPIANHPLHINSVASAIHRLLREPDECSNAASMPDWSSWAKAAIDARNSTAYQMRTTVLLCSTPEDRHSRTVAFSSFVDEATGKSKGAMGSNGPVGRSESSLEDYSRHLRLLFESIRVTVTPSIVATTTAPFPEGDSAANVVVVKETIHTPLFPSTFIRLLLHPVNSLRRWAMDELLRALRSISAPAVGHHQTSSAAGEATACKERAAHAWVIMMQYLLLQEQLVGYIWDVCGRSGTAETDISAAQPSLLEKKSFPTSSEEVDDVRRAAMIPWLSAVACDGARLVTALQRHIQQAAAPAGAASASVLGGTGLLPPPEVTSSVPHVIGNMLLEAIYLVGRNSSIHATAASHYLNPQQDVLPLPPLLQATEGRDQLVRSWVHGLIVDAKATSRLLVAPPADNCSSSAPPPMMSQDTNASSLNSTDAATLLRLSWGRLLWSWQVTGRLPPYVGSKQQQQPLANSSAATLFESLRDSLFKLTLANMLTQHQLPQLAQEGSALYAANHHHHHHHHHAPHTSTSTTIPTSADTLSQWRRRAAGCAMTACVLIAAFHSSSSNSVTTSPKSYESLTFHGVVLDQAQNSRGGLIKLIDMLHHLGNGFPGATPQSLLAPHLLLHELITVDLIAALRTRNPSTATNMSLWKLLPSMVRDALLKKRDVDGALKTILALMMCLVPTTPSLGTGNQSTSGGVLDDLHLLYLSPTASTTRPEVTTSLVSCVSDICTTLDTTDAVQLVAQFVVSTLRRHHNHHDEHHHHHHHHHTEEEAARAPSLFSSMGGRAERDAVIREVSPLLSALLSTSSSTSSGFGATDPVISLLEHIGRAAWVVARCADPKLRRIGEIFVRRIFAHSDVVTVAPVMVRDSSVSTPIVITRDLWQAEAASSVWALTLRQPAIVALLQRTMMPESSSLSSGPLKASSSCDRDDESDDENTIARAQQQCVTTLKASLARTPINSKLPAEIASVARAQIAGWIDVLGDVLLTPPRSWRSVDAAADATHCNEWLIRIAWGATCVLEVMNGATVSSGAVRKQFLLNGVLRVVQHFSTTPPIRAPPLTTATESSNEEEVGLENVTSAQYINRLECEGTLIQRNVLMASMLYLTLSKASLFDSPTLLTVLMDTCRAMHPMLAAYLTFTSRSEKQLAKKNAASTASLTSLSAFTLSSMPAESTASLQELLLIAVPTPESVGLPSKKQWLLAFHGVWKQLPASDRMTLKTAAHARFPWLVVLLDATKDAQNDAEKKREDAFAQFEREDEFQKVKEDLTRRAEGEQARMAKESDRKAELEREHVAAERRSAQDAKQKKTQLDQLLARQQQLQQQVNGNSNDGGLAWSEDVDGEDVSWGKRAREDDDVQIVGVTKRRIDRPVAVTTTTTAAPPQGTGGDGAVIGAIVREVNTALQATTTHQGHGLLSSEFSLMHGGGDKPIAAPMPAVRIAATPSVGNMRLMVASERRKAVPACNASKATLVKQLTDVALNTNLQKLLLSSFGGTSSGGRANHHNNADFDEDNNGGSSFANHGASAVSTDDIVGPSGIFCTPRANTAEAIPASFHPAALDEHGMPVRLDTTMASLVTWDSIKHYVEAFMAPLALELRHDVCNAAREFMDGWRKHYKRKEGSSALISAGALPAVLRRNPTHADSAPPPHVGAALNGGLRTPGGGKGLILLHIGSPTQKSSTTTTAGHIISPTTGNNAAAPQSSPLMYQLSDGDAVLIVIPIRSPPPSYYSGSATTAAPTAAARAHPQNDFSVVVQCFGFAVGMVKELNHGERTVVVQISDHQNTADVTNALMRSTSATRSNLGGGVDLFVGRLGTQVAQHGLMAVAMHDLLFTHFRDAILQPQLHTTIDSQKFLNDAAALVKQEPPPSTVPNAAEHPVTTAHLRARLSASLNEYQRAAVHAALHGLGGTANKASSSPTTDTAAEGASGADADVGGRFVLIEGPPGTGKTQTIHSIIAALLREAPSQRILVCAPSNTAVDELLLRLKRSGVAGMDGRRYMPRLLRVGVRDSVLPELLDASPSIFYDDIVAEVTRKDERLSGSGGITAADAKLLRQKLKDSVLADAQVICVTLGSLRQIMQQRKSLLFEYVIIDEASQATEPQTILPLTMGCKRCVLVGDTNQLQPTILSAQASRAGLGRSLMARLLVAAHGSVKLRMQYRMVPSISGFPNAEFYHGILVDAPNVRVVPRPTAVPSLATFPTIPRMLFIDVKGSFMNTAFPSMTLCNQPEAQVLVEQMRNLRLLLGLSVSDFAARAGVITFYKGQQSTIRRLLNDEENRAMSIDTVDGFQGKEKDIIFVSCVRGPRSSHHHNNNNSTSSVTSVASSVVANNNGSAGSTADEIRALGFVSDRNRMNVALTRAKDILVVVGHANTLASVEGPWRRFVAYAAQEGDFTVFREGVESVHRVEKGANVFQRYKSA